jgi:hypothetical protein
MRETKGKSGVKENQSEKKGEKIAHVVGPPMQMCPTYERTRRVLPRRRIRDAIPRGNRSIFLQYFI